MARSAAYIEIAGDDEFLMMFTPTKKKRRTSLEKGGLGTDEGEGMRRTPAAERPLIENDGGAEVN